MTPPRAAPPSDGAVTLDVTLLGRSYKVACKDDERAELMAAVTLLEARLQEIRAGGKITGTERIAVMAALNLAHELLRERAAPAASKALHDPNAQVGASSVDASAARRRIAAMQATIDRVLAGAQATS
jgi:cell division protein ZapA